MRLLHLVVGVVASSCAISIATADPERAAPDDVFDSSLPTVRERQTQFVGKGRRPCLKVDDRGFPHVTYSTAEGLIHAERVGSRWRPSMIHESGDGASMALGTQRVPHVAFVSQDRLKYATRDRLGTWSVTEVDTATEAARPASIALNARGEPRIAYLVPSDGDYSYRYAEWIEGSWRITSTDDRMLFSSFIDLVVDGDDQPHIVLESDRVLEYISREGGRLRTFWQKGDANEGRVTMGADGRVRVVYTGWDDYDYGVHSCVGTRDEFDCEPIEYVAAAGLAAATSGQVALASYRRTGRVILAANRSDGWSIDALTDPNPDHGATSVDLDKQGRAWIAFERGSDILLLAPGASHGPKDQSRRMAAEEQESSSSPPGTQRPEVSAWPSPWREGPLTIAMAGNQTLVGSTVRVFDVTGRCLATFTPRTTHSARQEHIWDGRDANGGGIAPGILFLEVAGRDFVQRTKVVRLR